MRRQEGATSSYCIVLYCMYSSISLLLFSCHHFFSAASGGDPEAETGARLTCHLLLRLLRTKGGETGMMTVRSTCDVHLLEAAHDNLLVGAVVAVLKVTI